MKHVQIRNINEVEVVVGFSPPSIDPMATRNLVREMTHELPEAKEAEVVRSRLDEVAKRQAQFSKELENLDPLNFANPKDFKKARTSLRAAWKCTKEEVEKHRAVLGMKMQELYEGAKELAKENVVFLVNPGCREVKEKIWEDLKKASRKLPPGHFLTLEGKVIPDWRDRVVYYEGEDGIRLTKCSALGQAFPKGAHLFDEASQAEREELVEQERVREIRKLSPEERADLEVKEMDDLALQAVTQERAAYLSGQADPEKIARNWLREKQREVRDAYLNL